MNRETEDKVRAALAEQAAGITPATLRHPDLPRPRRRRPPAPLVMAALVVALLVGGSIGMTAFRSPDTAQALATRVPTVTIGAVLPTSGSVTVIDGIKIPTPPAWTVTELTPRAGARQVCLTKADQGGTSCARGMVFTIAATANGQTAAITTRPPDLCPGAKQIMTYHPAVTIDKRPAVKYQIQCDGRGNTAEYWQLTDQTLSISTPLTGDPETYEHIIAEIDLRGWAHQS